MIWELSILFLTSYQYDCHCLLTSCSTLTPNYSLFSWEQPGELLKLTALHTPAQDLPRVFHQRNNNLPSSHDPWATRPYEISCCPSVTSSPIFFPSFLTLITSYVAVPWTCETCSHFRVWLLSPLLAVPELLIFLSLVRSQFKCYLFKEPLPDRSI